MSMFLGPIHYWLYNKIGNQEKLTAEIAKYAVDKNYIDSSEQYTKQLPPLETVIDESNIHGWLQGQINDAETRYAKLIEMLLSNGVSLESVCEVAYNFGKENALESASTAETAYKAFEDFFVNGMPCDRINAITKNENGIIEWQQTQDIHAQYWNSNSAPYYQLRNSVMQGMLANANLSLTNDNSVWALTTDC